MSSSVSHSVVEKNRRDRINTLIEELRDLVPPQSGSSAARAKHAVLYDTVVLLRRLQDKIRSGEAERQKMQEQKQLRTFQGLSAVSTSRSSRSSQSDHSSGDSRQPEHQHQQQQQQPKKSTELALPVAPGDAGRQVGVVIQQGPGCFYVKVSCKDRRGLLADILNGLKHVPAEVVTAAVTTSIDGHAYDVFEVRLEKDQDLGPQDLQCAIHSALYSAQAKRQRVEE